MSLLCQQDWCVRRKPQALGKHVSAGPYACYVCLRTNVTTSHKDQSLQIAAQPEAAFLTKTCHVVVCRQDVETLANRMESCAGSHNTILHFD